MFFFSVISWDSDVISLLQRENRKEKWKSKNVIMLSSLLSFKVF